MGELRGDLVLSDPIERLPVLFVWPHSGCDCRCLMCDIWKNRARQEIASDDIARWRDDWRHLGIKQVVLTGGEALLHSRLAALCEALRASDIAIMLLSTGITLERHAELVVANCESVRVSLDGPEAVHNQIRRVPRAYERLVLGVRTVNRERPDVTQRCGMARPLLGWRL